jgi:hypothetical protein
LVAPPPIDLRSTSYCHNVDYLSHITEFEENWAEGELSFLKTERLGKHISVVEDRVKDEQEKLIAYAGIWSSTAGM